MAEFRLDELSQRSGVSPRNIRAYQDRGLLHPPKREGRSAVYDDEHLWQLQIITQLLDKGYTIAHIQDFFEGFAKNLDLADILGVQELAQSTGMGPALTGPWQTPVPRRGTAPGPLRLDPFSVLGRKLVDAGIASLEGDDLVIVDPDIAAIVDGAKDQTFYLNVLLGVRQATGHAVSQLAEMMVNELRNRLVEHYGEGWVPPVDQQRDLAAVIMDTRELGSLVVNKTLNAALAENAVRVVGEYLEGMMSSADGSVDEFIKAIAAEFDGG